MSTHTLFTTLDEIPFDDLFNASLEKMDSGTYKWLITDQTPEEKKAQILWFVSWILEQPDAFNYKVEIDGKVVVAVFGARKGDDVFANISLLQPDANGSRSYIYRQDIRDDRTALLLEQGIKNFHGFMEPDSALKANLEYRNAVKPEDYTPLNTPYSPEQMVYVHWRDSDDHSHNVYDPQLTNL